MNVEEGRVRPSKTLKSQDVNVMESWLCLWFGLIPSQFQRSWNRTSSSPSSCLSLPFLLLLPLLPHQTSTDKGRPFLNTHPIPNFIPASSVPRSNVKKPFAHWCHLMLALAFLYTIFIFMIFFSPQTSSRNWERREAVTCSRSQSLFTVSSGLQPVLLP